jgi:hypothetical protein
MNLQWFIKQPRINSRQARWLVHLTPYDFIIRHRRGLLNPADRPSKRPDYMAKAQREPSLAQKDLLTSKLETGLDSDRPRATKPDFPLCEIAKCQLCEVAKDILLCEVAKCQLCEVAKAVPDIQLCDTVRPKLDYTVARSRPALAIIARFKFFDSEAGHLLELVRIQAITRGEAKKAAREKHPFAKKPARGLINLILKS